MQSGNAVYFHCSTPSPQAPSGVSPTERAWQGAVSSPQLMLVSRIRIWGSAWGPPKGAELDPQAKCLMSNARVTMTDTFARSFSF